MPATNPPTATSSGVRSPSDLVAAVEKIVDLTRKAERSEIVTVPTAGLGAHLPPSIPLLWSPADRRFVTLRDELVKWRAAPERKRGVAKAATLDAFVDLVNRHKTADSAVFADPTWSAPSFTAVIDYHEAKSAGRADNAAHRIAYAFPLSDEWKAWTEAAGEPMQQLTFAQFLEDRISDLCSPTEAEKIDLERRLGRLVATAAEVMTLSRGLEVNVNSRLKNQQRLASGEAQIAFETEHAGADGKPLKVPGLFMLAITPFFRGETMRIPVRLNYRVGAGGGLFWQFVMFEADKAVTDRVRFDLDRVAKDTGLPCYEAAPEA